VSRYAPSDSALLGGIPVSSPSELDGFFEDAADEIDAAIGAIYEIPVTRSLTGGSLPGVTGLFLKRINRYLASGRFILARAAGGEDDNLHAYGLSLVREAQNAIMGIANGSTQIDAKRLVTDDRDQRKAPAIANAEAASNVDSFYGYMTGTDGMVFSPTSGPFGVGALEVERGY
jgi:hypothetical protein